MNEVEKRIEELENRVRILQNKQWQFNDDLNILQNELRQLKAIANNDSVTEDKKLFAPEPREQQPLTKATAAQPVQLPTQQPSTLSSNQKLEDFIGTNLTNKIGILITIIGIFIGAKYAIDKELISPFMRIVSGYLAGGALIAIAARLKAKYQNFSAVLMGGGLAVVYFITYISYSFYQLLPQTVTFILMVGITIVAVTIALWYNQKIIAILGQVAAYAIPFLLSDGSGRILILFSYISIINIGLIYLSFKKDWKILYRIAFYLTWLISITWMISGESEMKHFGTGLFFLAVNFFTFYITFLSYKIIRKELYNVREVAIVLLNAFIFFFLGTNLIDSNNNNEHLLTIFTLSNAIIHLIVGYLVYRLRLADKTVYQFLIGLGLLFITVAIPVELNGSWVTLLWTIEATILCWIGIQNNRSLYLKIAAPMVIIALLSLVQDWMAAYPAFGDLLYTSASANKPFLNLTFIFSFVVSVCFGFIHFKSFKAVIGAETLIDRFFKQAMPLVFWLTLYFTFFNEIHYLWHLRINQALKNQPAEHYQQISLLIYTLLFFASLLELNKRLIKNRSVDERLLIGGIFICIIFLTNGLISLGNLREIYIEHAKVGNASLWMLAVRYVSFLAVGIFYLAEWQAVKRIGTSNSKKIFSMVFNITLLTIICNEFINWMDLAGYQNQYKLGLSIICGLYALILIFAGIIRKQKHLRIGAIVLFTVTLLKLFFYDLATLSTVSKTIVLVLLGIILLIVSFLYNKYKDVILGEDQK
ncbi:MAG TPA: DUF2339 domain-containing protein [Segetibacter sp.]|jgi:uncharacterized membrane protein